MHGLDSKGMLCARTTAEEWILPRSEQVLEPPSGYVVSFAAFHERGFGSPLHDFLRGLLHHYEIELHHLNPSGIQHMVAFVALFEGYLGVEPHFDLWCYFFKVELHKNRIPGRTPVVYSIPAMGCASIRLWQPKPAREYMNLHLIRTNQGWHKSWFYNKSFPHVPLPMFIGRVFAVAPAIGK